MKITPSVANNICQLYKNGEYYMSINEIEGALISYSSCASIIHTVLEINKPNEQDTPGIPRSSTGAPLSPRPAEQSQNTGETSQGDDELLNKAFDKDCNISDSIEFQKCKEKLEKIFNKVLAQVESLQKKLKQVKSSQAKQDDEEEGSDWAEKCTKIHPLVFGGKKDCIYFSDIAGLDKQKNMIKESLVKPLIYPNLYPKIGKGFLLYGPPGTGKTLLAKAAVNELQKTDPNVKVLFFNPTGAELKGKYVGETEKRIKEHFVCASRAACQCELDTGNKVNFISVIFIDEMDSIAGDRASDSTGLVANSVNTLLQMMDGIDSFENVAVIGATNFPWNLDSAVLRRLDTQVLLDVPDSMQISAQLDIEFEKFISLSDREMEVCQKHDGLKKKGENADTVKSKKKKAKKNSCISKCPPPGEKTDITKQFPYNSFKFEFKSMDSKNYLKSLANEMASKGTNYSNSDVNKVMTRAANFTAGNALKNNVFYKASVLPTLQAATSGPDNTKKNILDFYLSTLNLPNDPNDVTTLEKEYFDQLNLLLTDKDDKLKQNDVKVNTLQPEAEYKSTVRNTKKGTLSCERIQKIKDDFDNNFRSLINKLQGGVGTNNIPIRPGPLTRPSACRADESIGELIHCEINAYFQIYQLDILDATNNLTLDADVVLRGGNDEIDRDQIIQITKNLTQNYQKINKTITKFKNTALNILKKASPKGCSITLEDFKKSDLLISRLEELITNIENHLNIRDSSYRDQIEEDDELLSKLIKKSIPEIKEITGKKETTAESEPRTSLKEFYDKFYIQDIPNNLYVDHSGIDNNFDRFYNHKILISKHPDIKAGDDNLIEELFIRTDLNIASQILSRKVIIPDDPNKKYIWLEKYIKTINSLNLQNKTRIKYIIEDLGINKTHVPVINDTLKKILKVGVGGAIVAGTIWAAGGHKMFMEMITGTKEVVRNLGEGAAHAGYGAFGQEPPEYAPRLAGQGAVAVAGVAALGAAVSGAAAVGEGVLDFFSNLRDTQEFDVWSLILKNVKNNSREVDLMIKFKKVFKQSNSHKEEFNDKMLDYGISPPLIEAIREKLIIAYTRKYYFFDSCKKLFKEFKDILHDGSIGNINIDWSNQGTTKPPIKGENIYNKLINNNDNISIGDIHKFAGATGVSSVDFSSSVEEYIQKQKDLEASDEDTRNLTKLRAYDNIIILLSLRISSIDIPEYNHIAKPFKILFDSVFAREIKARVLDDDDFLLDFKFKRMDISFFEYTKQFLTGNAPTSRDINAENIDKINKHLESPLTQDAQGINKLAKAKEESYKSWNKSTHHTDNLTIRDILEIINVYNSTGVDLTEKKDPKSVFLNNINEEDGMLPKNTIIFNAVSRYITKKYQYEFVEKDKKENYLELKKKFALGYKQVLEMTDDQSLDENLKKLKEIIAENDRTQGDQNKISTKIRNIIDKLDDTNSLISTLNTQKNEYLKINNYYKKLFDNYDITYHTQLYNVGKLTDYEEMLEIHSNFKAKIKQRSLKSNDDILSMTRLQQDIRNIVDNIRKTATDININTDRISTPQILRFIYEDLHPNKIYRLGGDLTVTDLNDNFDNVLLNKIYDISVPSEFLCSAERRFKYFFEHTRLGRQLANDNDTSTPIQERPDFEQITEIKRGLTDVELRLKEKDCYIRSTINLSDPNYREVYSTKSLIRSKLQLFYKYIKNLKNAQMNNDRGTFENEIKKFAGTKFSYLGHYSLLATHFGIASEWTSENETQTKQKWGISKNNRIEFLKINRTPDQKRSDDKSSQFNTLFTMFGNIEEFEEKDEEDETGILKKIFQGIKKYSTGLLNLLLNSLRAIYSQLSIKNTLIATAFAAIFTAITGVSILAVPLGFMATITFTVKSAIISLIIEAFWNLITSFVSKPNLSVSQKWLKNYMGTPQDYQKEIPVTFEETTADVSIRKIGKAISVYGGINTNIELIDSIVSNKTLAVAGLAGLAGLGTGSQLIALGAAAAAGTADYKLDSGEFILRSWNTTPSVGRWGGIYSTKNLKILNNKDDQTVAKENHIKKKIKVLDISPAQIKYAMLEQATSYNPKTAEALKEYDKDRIKFLSSGKAKKLREDS